MQVYIGTVVINTSVGISAIETINTPIATLKSGLKLLVYAVAQFNPTAKAGGGIGIVSNAQVRHSGVVTI